jgi:hypothetical protein
MQQLLRGSQLICILISDPCTGPIEGVATGHRFCIDREGKVTLRRVGRCLASGALYKGRGVS